MSIFYTRRFYDRDYARTSRSAATVVPHILGLLREAGNPASIIDIGCGRGVWLQAFEQNGIADVAGRDGPWTDRNRLLIDQARFDAVDLNSPITAGRRFDLAMSLEVAEHLGIAFADQFVESLTSLSETIIFSAAIRGQGGQHHVNEQNLSFWTDRFARHGYRLFDVIRPWVWNDTDVCWWYRQNMVVFAKQASPYAAALSAAAARAPAIVDLAHPDGFHEKARLANIFSPEESIGTYAARLKRRLFA